jgi:2-dehydro-3-deoxyphosphogluconate aldolase/(4S)-4-hydroxy-2-oxoglutarate aldolase
MKPIEAIMRTAPVIPVLVIDDVAHAVPVARAGQGRPACSGSDAAHPAALDAITAMKASKAPSGRRHRDQPGGLKARSTLAPNSSSRPA